MLDKKAYRDAHDGVENEDSSFWPLDRDKSYQTPTIAALDILSQVHIVTWAPVVLLGWISLSNGLRGLTAIFIEHILSNAMLPAYIYSLY